MHTVRRFQFLEHRHVRCLTAGLSELSFIELSTCFSHTGHATLCLQPVPWLFAMWLTRVSRRLNRFPLSILSLLTTAQYLSSS